MGCRVSKHESLSEVPPPSHDTMAQSDQGIDFKAKLERKLYLAKETPEPDFDLSGCALKAVPSGVFILCRVLRKETLDLSKNNLRILDGGGQLNDLHLLRTLDLRYNQFKLIPPDLCRLENLKELMVSHNKLVRLPDVINQLRNLEILDCSFNQLTEINQINCMPHLRILNVCGNGQLTNLPSTLATCDSLVDIVFDTEIVLFPPAQVLDGGTLAILNYLMLNPNYVVPDLQDWQNKTKKDVNYSRKEIDSNDEMYKEFTKGKKFIDSERKAMEKSRFQEEELHHKHQMKREGLLQELLKQKNESDDKMMKMQQDKESERKRLISSILKTETDSNIIVDKMLTIKTDAEACLLENERREHEQILQRLRVQHTSFRKQEVLSAMSALLLDEQQKVYVYQQQRDAATVQILEDDSRANQLLSKAYHDNDRARLDAAAQLLQDEDLQKTAVCSLIAKNDSRSWALIEKMRIVESQLVAMTHIEIERRKMSVDENLADLGQRRLDLTYVLIELMAQQEQRKQQLMVNLSNLQNQSDCNQNDFWLLQYQKLIDSQPNEMRQDTGAIDPMLGYSLLTNGVIHCLPFLSRICKLKQTEMGNITDSDLEIAGVKAAADREAIKCSIQSYLENTNDIAASAPALQNTNDTVVSKLSSDETLMECVICMDEPSKIIFLPCGHLCCCLHCQETLQLCPICRSSIDKRVKVIQP